MMNTSDHGNPSTKTLREFAYTMALAFPIFFCLLLPWLFSVGVPYWPLWLSAIFLLQAWIYPPSLLPVRKLWLRIGAVLGWINTHIILALLFYGLITPIGWIQRNRHKLHYKVGYEREKNTYKIPRTQRLTPEDLENPF